MTQIENAKSFRTIALAFVQANGLPEIFELTDDLGATATIDLNRTDASGQSPRAIKNNEGKRHLSLAEPAGAKYIGELFDFMEEHDVSAVFTQEIKTRFLKSAIQQYNEAAGNYVLEKNRDIYSRASSESHARLTSISPEEANTVPRASEFIEKYGDILAERSEARRVQKGGVPKAIIEQAEKDGQLVHFTPLRRQGHSSSEDRGEAEIVSFADRVTTNKNTTLGRE